MKEAVEVRDGNDEDRLDAQIATAARLHGCIGCGRLSLGFSRLLNPGDEAAARGPGSRYILDAEGPPAR